MPSPFDWSDLGRFKKGGRFLDLYPDILRTFWSPVDDVHGVLKALMASAQHSLVIAMYGWDDPELDAIVRAKATDDQVYVQMSLDKTQAAGKHEAELLELWHHDAFGTSIAIGQSAGHAISHVKAVIVDGVYLVGGSTNWSLSGERAQDNECRIYRDAVLCAEARARLDAIHNEMLRQMAARPV